MAPRLLAAFGTDRSRLENADQVQTYSGIAPVLVRSGATHQVPPSLGLQQVFASDVS